MFRWGGPDRVLFDRSAAVFSLSRNGFGGYWLNNQRGQYFCRRPDVGGALNGVINRSFSGGQIGGLVGTFDRRLEVAADFAGEITGR